MNAPKKSWAMLIHKSAYPVGYADMLPYSVFVISPLRVSPILRRFVLSAEYFVKGRETPFKI